jgi:hypothetical protein
MDVPKIPLTKVLAEGKGRIVRFCLKGWSKAEGEPQARATVAQVDGTGVQTKQNKWKNL